VNSIQANVTGRKAALPLPPETVLAYRVNDAAKVAGLSRSSLYVLIGEGKLRSVLIAGRRLIPADALRDLLRRDARDASYAVIALVFLAPDDLGNAFDLAAWEPETGRLALWLGRVSMLGQDNLYYWRLGAPLIVHETPLEWLQAGRGGVFVIDHQRASPLLRMVEPLGVKRPEFGRQLQAALTIRAPRIVVAARPAVAA
jgi:hypothetical protein